MAADQNNITSVELVYAEALLDLAEQTGLLDEIADEMQQLGELINEQPDLQQLMASRVLTSAQRSEALKTIFHDRINDLTYRFMQIVNEKDRLGEFGRIVNAFAKLVDQRHGIVEADAFVANRLSDDRVRQLSEQLGRAVGRNVVLHQYVQPHLIGGLKLRIGDRLMDGSVATQLKLIRQKIIDAGQQKTRTNLAGVLEE